MMAEERPSFNKLPSDLLSLLLTDWLDWKEVVRYDAAMCNNADRTDWLTVLQNSCIFRSVSIAHWNTRYNIGWLVARCIRVKSISFGRFLYLIESEFIEELFRRTGSTLESISTETRETKFIFPSIVQNCFALKRLRFGECCINDMYWNIVRNNPHLIELRLIGDCYNTCVDKVPLDIPLPLLRKLETNFGALGKRGAAILLQQTPALQSLKLRDTASNITGELLNLIPNLVHLDMSKLYRFKVGEKGVLALLMKGLKSGLRSLLLPHGVTFTEALLRTVVKYHASSLHSLSLPMQLIETSKTGCMGNFLNLVNDLPLLHTVQLQTLTLSSLTTPTGETFVNPTVTHLLIHCVSFNDSLDLGDSFPSINTLSLLQLNDAAEILLFLQQLLVKRPLIRTVGLDNDKLIAQMRTALPEIRIIECCGIEIFEH